jgi:hypothetical protein
MKVVYVEDDKYAISLYTKYKRSNPTRFGIGRFRSVAGIIIASTS